MATPSSADDARARAFGRWLALDVFRAIAVLSMIQGHVFTALLRPSELEGGLRSAHSLVHGLTAPMFLLGGGLAYGLSALREGGAPGLRLVRRGLFLIALGYVLALPAFPTWERLSQPAFLAQATRIGPLQLIGACLLLCELLRVCARSRDRLLAALCVVTLALTAAAPWVWRARPSDGALLALGTWLDGYAGSTFPLFPWAAFFVLGVLLSLPVIATLRGEGRSSVRALRSRLLGAGALAAASTYASFLGGYVLREIYGEHELWQTSPLHVLFRAGLVLVWLAVLWHLESRLRAIWDGVGSVRTLVGALSKHSLVAYVAHLLVLYGTPLTTGLVRAGQTLSLLEATAVASGLIVWTTAVAVLWSRFDAAGSLPWRMPWPRAQPRLADLN